jgi:A/G-specific adenine glycosylase
VIPDFADRLIAWQQRSGRHDLPWQVRDPYAVWVSEIMLQQTQVETVIPYYRRFMARFPDLASLAAAPEDEVLALWSGLGYYARARNLQAAAWQIMAEHDGVFPPAFDVIQSLPGVGRSTAAAISAFAFGEQRAILDGNVKRVFCRLLGIEGWPGEKAIETRLWTLAEDLLPAANLTAYTQGLMDLGATLCRRARPDCPQCPFAGDCVAKRQGRQGELPSPRPSKILPEKGTAMLIMVHAGELLLEKRRTAGIWGGLWSLPECEVEVDAVKQAQRLGYEAAWLRDLPSLKHSFSHFRLQIHPRLLSVRQRPVGVAEPGHIWLPLADALDAALPMPVRKILSSLQGAVA